MTEPEERKLPDGFSMAGLTFVLAALSWLGPFSIDTYLPSLPSISKSLGASAAQVQQTMTAFLAFFAFMSLWHGAISDAYGRRRLTLICLAVFALASLGCATAVNLHFLLFFRALQGATAGAGMVVGRAVVRDLFEGAGAQRLMSHVATIFTIAPIVAPVAGGYLQSWFGWRSIFILLILLSTCLLIASWRWLPETLPHNQRQPLAAKYLARSYWKVMTSPPFLLACASMGFTSAGFFIYIMGAPQFLMKHLHLRETQFLWLFGPMAVGMIVGAWISGYCAGKISGNRTIMLGYLVMAIAAYRQYPAQHICAADSALDDRAACLLCGRDVDCHAQPDAFYAGPVPVTERPGGLLPGCHQSWRQLRRFGIRPPDLGHDTVDGHDGDCDADDRHRCLAVLFPSHEALSGR